MSSPSDPSFMSASVDPVTTAASSSEDMAMNIDTFGHINKMPQQPVTSITEADDADGLVPAPASKKRKATDSDDDRNGDGDHSESVTSPPQSITAAASSTDETPTVTQVTHKAKTNSPRSTTPSSFLIGLNTQTITISSAAEAEFIDTIAKLSGSQPALMTVQLAPAVAAFKDALSDLLQREWRDEIDAFRSQMNVIVSAQSAVSSTVSDVQHKLDGSHSAALQQIHVRQQQLVTYYTDKERQFQAREKIRIKSEREVNDRIDRMTVASSRAEAEAREREKEMREKYEQIKIENNVILEKTKRKERELQLSLDTLRKEKKETDIIHNAALEKLKKEKEKEKLKLETEHKKEIEREKDKVIYEYNDKLQTLKDELKQSKTTNTHSHDSSSTTTGDGQVESELRTYIANQQTYISELQSYVEKQKTALESVGEQLRLKSDALTESVAKLEAETLKRSESERLLSERMNEWKRERESGIRSEINLNAVTAPPALTPLPPTPPPPPLAQPTPVAPVQVTQQPPVSLFKNINDTMSLLQSIQAVTQQANTQQQPPVNLFPPQQQFLPPPPITQQQQRPIPLSVSMPLQQPFPYNNGPQQPMAQAQSTFIPMHPARIAMGAGTAVAPTQPPVNTLNNSVGLGPQCFR